MAKKSRSDADRRLRQCERLGRVVRTLQLIMGNGRWDAEALARDLQCSTRTVHRILQTLSLAGVPWFYDQEASAYRVRPGYRFPAITQDRNAGSHALENSDVSRPELLAKLIRDGEAFQESLGEFLAAMKKTAGGDS